MNHSFKDFEYRQLNTCLGCRDDIMNQEGHVGFGGCLYVDSYDTQVYIDSYDTSVNSYDTSVNSYNTSQAYVDSYDDTVYVDSYDTCLNQRESSISHIANQSHI